MATAANIHLAKVDPSNRPTHSLRSVGGSTDRSTFQLFFCHLCLVPDLLSRVAVPLDSSVTASGLCCFVQVLSACKKTQRVRSGFHCSAVSLTGNPCRANVLFCYGSLAATPNACSKSLAR